MSDMVELEGGVKKCKFYQKRSKATGHCRNRRGSRSPWNAAGRQYKMRRLSNGDLRKEWLSFKVPKVRGGEVIEGGDVVEVVQLVEGGAKKPCKKYQKRSKSTGHCKNVLARMSPTMRKSKSKSRSRKMRGGEVIEGGEVELVEGGAKCKRGKTRRGTGVCHKPKSRSRSRSRSRRM